MTRSSQYQEYLKRTPASVFEAALCICAEHDPDFAPVLVMDEMDRLRRELHKTLPASPTHELAQLMLRHLNALGFQQDDWNPPKPESALLHHIVQRRRGQPLGIALIAMELARRMGFALEGVNFPGHFLLRVPGADHLLDPCGGRRLYPKDCHELLVRQYGPAMALHAEHLSSATPTGMLQRMSRNLRHLHRLNNDLISALKDANRIIELGEATSNDHVARADLYHALSCPQAERFDLERALLLSDDPVQRLQLSERLGELPAPASLH